MRIARVATRAGASTALVHHYFSTREELLEQALIHSFEQRRRGALRRARRRPTSPATEGLARAIESACPSPGRQERDWVLWVELWLRAVREPGLRPLAARLYGRYREWMAALIRAGAESGEFRSDRRRRRRRRGHGTARRAGVRALIDDPAMDVEAARALVAGRLASELGIEAAALAE